MMWVAIVYALVATLLTHRVGRSLIPIQYDRQRFEADFRYTLVRFRENVEAVALAGGEDGERRSAMNHFRRVVDNYWRLIRAQRNLTLVTTGIGQSNSIVPYVIAAPGFFAGTLSLGSVVQTNIAYGQVSGALVWFVNAYQEIANWRASIERLVTFDEEIESTCGATAELRVDRSDGAELRLDHVHLTRPDGKTLVDDASGVIRRGEHVALVGPMGAGKRTLLRAIAGIWRFGKRSHRGARGRDDGVPAPTALPADRNAARGGCVSVARRRLSRRRDPRGAGAGGARARSRRASTKPRTGNSSSRGGEEQRLSIARVLLQKPDWIFLDKATSALDEPSEQHLYQVAAASGCPTATIVSIANRPGVVQRYGRSWTLVPGPEGSQLQAA